MDKQYITVAEAARKLGISDRAVRQWIASDKLEAERNGRSWRIPASAISNGKETEDDFRVIAQMQSEIDHLRNELAEKDRKLASADFEVAHLNDMVEEKTDQIRHLRDGLSEKDAQLSRRDEQIESLTQQIDHMTQVVAMSQKNIGALTEQLDSSRQMIEDMRQRPWWQRLLRRG